MKAGELCFFRDKAAGSAVEKSRAGVTCREAKNRMLEEKRQFLPLRSRNALYPLPGKNFSKA